MRKRKRKRKRKQYKLKIYLIFSFPIGKERMANPLILKERYDLFVSICASNQDSNQCIWSDLPLGTDQEISWKLEENPGDGHCFYHGILRGLRDLNLEPDLVSKLKNGQILAIYEDGKAVTDFREKLLNFVINENNQSLEKLDEEIQSLKFLIHHDEKFSNDENNRSLEKLDEEIQSLKFSNDEKLEKMQKDYQARNESFVREEMRMWRGLDAANRKRIATGDCYASLKEVEATARLFNICIAIWSDNGYWTVSGPRSGSGLDSAQDISDVKDCPNVIFLDNSGGNHFNTLEPRWESAPSPKSKEKLSNRYCMYRYDNKPRRKGPKGLTCKMLKSGRKNLKEESNRLGCCLEGPWLNDCAWISGEGCTLKSSRLEDTDSDYSDSDDDF